MSGSNRGNGTEDVNPSKWLVVTVMVLMLIGGGTAFDEFDDLFLAHEYETSDQSHYAAKCHAVEFPNSAATHDKSTEGNDSQADWGRDYPPYCDLAAQYMAARSAERSAYYGKWTLALTAFGVVLLWLTLKSTRETLDQAAKTNNLGRDQGRAYVDVSEFFANVTDGEMRFYGRIENYGETPCTNVKVLVSISKNNPYSSDGPIIFYPSSIGGRAKGDPFECQIRYRKFARQGNRISITAAVHYRTIYGERYRSRACYEILNIPPDAEERADSCDYVSRRVHALGARQFEIVAEGAKTTA